MKLRIIILTMFIMTLMLFSSCVSSARMYKDAITRFNAEQKPENNVLGEDHLNHLPECIADYIRSCGWVGQPVPYSFEMKTTGEFAMSVDKGYKRVRSVQQNSLYPRNRIFKIRNPLFGGIHRYWDGEAGMVIKLLGIFTVVDVKGEEYDQSELLTWFNDACIAAPGMIPFIDSLTWSDINEREATANLVYHNIRVSARLYFNNDHELVNFITEDRYYADGNNPAREVRWSTPMEKYITVDGIKFPSCGEAVWTLPEGDFPYAKLNIESIIYNPKI